MTRMSNPSPVSTGALLVGGDWACAHGDIEALSFVAEQLSDRISGPLHGELVELARLCRRDEELAARQWPTLRRRLVTA